MATVTLGQKLRFLAITSVGFFADGYLNLTIGLGNCLNSIRRACVRVLTDGLHPVVPVLGYLYFPKAEVPTVDSDVMKGSLNLGMVVGQVVFGILGDAWGRRAIYGKELILTLFGTLMIILLPWRQFSPRAVTTWVSVFRVVTGLGIGAGVYRVAACHTRQQMMV